MNYYFSKRLSLNFDEAIERTIAALKTEGFGVLTDIDVQAVANPNLAEVALTVRQKLKNVVADLDDV